MKVGLALHSLLTGDTDVNTAVSGRVYPELAPEGTSMPYLVYSVVSNTPSDAKDGTPIDEAQVEIFSVASTYGSANDLADDVRAALDRKTASVSVDEGDIKVQSIHYTNEVTEVSADRDTYVSIQDYTVRINRVVASAPVDLLLDTYTGAAAAYSLRKLSNSYTGSAIRVRRQSDNTEQDIGFVSNELDTAALDTFCSGTNGFVKTWYDQAGSNDATQTTTANQPKIYDSSTGVVTENGKPAVEFDGVDDGLALGSIIAASSQKYTFTTHAVNSADIQWAIFYETVGTDVVPLASSGSGAGIVFGYTLNALYQDGGSAFSGTRNDLYNAYTAAGQSLTTIDFSGDGIGGFFNRSAFAYQGTAQEIVIYDSDQSTNRSGIETNINDFYSIY